MHLIKKTHLFKAKKSMFTWRRLSMKKLPINIDPYIRTYTQYAYLDMIINNENTNADTMLRFKVSEILDEKWHIDSGEANIQLQNHSVTISENYKTVKKDKYVYRLLKQQDEIIIKIDYQQYTNMWDSVGLFIDNTTENFDNYFNMQVLLGNYCGNYLMNYVQGKYGLIKGIGDEKKYPIWLKIKVNDDCMETYYALEENKWILAAKREKMFDWQNKKYIVGIFAAMSDRQYYKWLFNNFIQIRLDKNDGSAMNYSALVRRDSKNYTVHPFIRFSNEKLSVLQEYGIDLWQFIKGNINSGRYIEFMLNEKYIPGLESYKKVDKIHESLVYGYDDEKDIIYMISIYEGKPVCVTVKKEVFQHAYNMTDSRLANRFYIFELKPNNEPYDLDISGIIRQLVYYVEGVNPTLVYKNLVPQEKGIFGLKCYDAIHKDRDLKNAFLVDSRISYLMMEHKKCMKDRIDYLICMGYLDHAECGNILSYILDIYQKSKQVMNMVLKYKATGSNKVAERIWPILKGIKEMEVTCYRELIGNLRLRNE